MIDFDKELQKFQFLELDEDFIGLQNESSVIAKEFQRTLNRFGKEQGKTNLQLEEITGQLEEHRDKNSDKEQLKEELYLAEEEKQNLINGFILIMDQIEDLYRFSTKSSEESWSKQLELLWDNISNELLSIGIMKIEGENAQYNKNLHIAAEVRYCPEYEDGIILEVLRCGYVYKINVLRKAKVVVNKREDMGELTHE
ncbi:MAG TPA: nucleotide exchange factor GrpE [Clostridiales bacterium]|nr:nucleotide exchange factor GrpE [Clostridiales bacterium]